LRQQHGVVLCDETDTSVVLALYLVHGLTSSFFEALNGEFAFIIWDGVLKRLVVVRDRFGVKPLYWTLDGNRLAFASEMKAFVGLHGLERSFNQSLCFYILNNFFFSNGSPLLAWLDTLEPGFSHAPDLTFMKVRYLILYAHFLILSHLEYLFIDAWSLHDDRSYRRVD
jgi:asparagine synthase (glutamine-hydrolysing)